jgi:hypothetical protein
VNMTQDVFIFLQACVVGKSADDYVFTRSDGKPVLDFRERWDNLAHSRMALVCCSMICGVPPSATWYEGVFPKP